MPRPVFHIRRVSTTIYFLFWFLLLASCVPADPPAVLTNTPGVPIRIDDQRVYTEAFSLEYPNGWRVITSAADAPLSLIFAAPGNCALIEISVSDAALVDSLGADCPADVESLTREVALDDTSVFIRGLAPSADLDTFTPLFDTIIDSLQPTTP